MVASRLPKPLIALKRGMVAEVIISPAVEHELEVIGDYIAQSNEAAALKLVRAIRARCDSLKLMPERGTLYGPNHRRLIEGPYQIIYRIEISDKAEATVVIVAVHHSRRRPLEL